ncbi:MAG: DNA-directed RNA polymerase subunit omega [Acutalibacteraceae bacterium]|nr:DNA-directed RNA polymerase subunit omega [Acutalibacteraceae bacterium]
MLNPAIGKLIEAKDNRYKLVLQVAKEARDIAEKAHENDEIIVEKTVSLAINKLATEIE